MAREQNLDVYKSIHSAIFVASQLEFRCDCPGHLTSLTVNGKADSSFAPPGQLKGKHPCRTRRPQDQHLSMLRVLTLLDRHSRSTFMLGNMTMETAGRNHNRYTS